MTETQINAEQTRQSAPIDECQLERGISNRLSSLARKIRQYVVTHGLLLLATWLLVWFWVGFCLDYLPVLFGFPELSKTARWILLAIALTVAAWIAYRWILARALKRFDQQSLALLLERRFPQFDDSLATVTASHSKPGNSGADDNPNHRAKGDIELTSSMLNRARQSAYATIQSVRLSDVFRFRPLILAGVSTTVLTIAVGWIAIARPATFSTAFHRMVLLRDNQWPRDCHVELVGLKVKHAKLINGIPGMIETRSFHDGVACVAKSSGLSLLVRAQLPDGPLPNRRLPRVCEMIYRTDGGLKGRLPLNKIGGARNGYQSYALDHELFDSITQPIHFRIRGDDHVVGPFTIQPVDSPTIVESKLDCVFPEYLIDHSSSRYTSRAIDYRRGIKLPVGTRSKLNLTFDSAVTEAYIVDANGQLTNVEDCHNNRCQIPLGTINESFQLGVLVRSGEIFGRSVQSFEVTALADAPPKITSRLDGIGLAITPSARIPLVMEIDEVNAIRDTWIDLQTPATDVLAVTVDGRHGEFLSEIDLRRLRVSGKIPVDLPVDQEHQIALTVVARDFFNLQGKENIGTGPQHSLSIVSDDRLLRMLERDEADQRFRLEQVLGELTESRSYLDRALGRRPEDLDSAEPGDQPTEFENGEKNAAAQAVTANGPENELRQLFLQRTKVQVRKSQQEIRAIAYAFDQIRLQLINNRIDAEDRLERLDQSVAQPLTQIVEVTIPLLIQSLDVTDSMVSEAVSSVNDPGGKNRLVDKKIQVAQTDMDQLLAEIRAVLDSLLKFETQNELLDLVRNILEQQQTLQKRTIELRNREAFDDIFNK